MGVERPSFKKENPHRVELDESDVERETMHSSGPGGQNVNKVESKVRLRFNIAASGKLTEKQKSVLFKRLGSKITDEGELLAESQDTRSQNKNEEIALEKLNEMVNKALKPRKKRKKTKPTRASKERRLKKKREQAEKKKLRKPPEKPEGF